MKSEAKDEAECYKLFLQIPYQSTNALLPPVLYSVSDKLYFVITYFYYPKLYIKKIN